MVFLTSSQQIPTLYNVLSSTLHALSYVPKSKIYTCHSLYSCSFPRWHGTTISQSELNETNNKLINYDYQLGINSESKITTHFPMLRCIHTLVLLVLYILWFSYQYHLVTRIKWDSMAVVKYLLHAHTIIGRITTHFPLRMGKLITIRIGINK